MAHPGGRPPKYSTVEELDAAIDSYFSSLTPINYTLTGLCIALGITKETFYQYEKDDKFSDSIKVARLKIEYAYEMKLTNGSFPTSGCIFALKNFGWKDKYETDLTSGGDKINFANAPLEVRIVAPEGK